ncbi:hypothetical protein Dimus_030945 [Dionaea muscipula]
MGYEPTRCSRCPDFEAATRHVALWLLGAAHSLHYVARSSGDAHSSGCCLHGLEGASRSLHDVARSSGDARSSGCCPHGLEGVPGWTCAHMMMMVSWLRVRGFTAHTSPLPAWVTLDGNVAARRSAMLHVDARSELGCMGLFLVRMSLC